MAALHQKSGALLAFSDTTAMHKTTVHNVLPPALRALRLMPATAAKVLIRSSMVPVNAMPASNYSTQGPNVCLVIHL